MVNNAPKKSHTTHLWMCLFVHHSFLQTLQSPHVSPSPIERTPVSRNAGRDQAHDAESQTGNGADCNLELEWPFGWGIFTCLPKMCWKCVLVFTDSMDSAEVLIRFFCRLLKSCGFAMFRPHFFVHLIVPDFTATLCDPFEGQNFKTSLSLRVEVRVHFECHGGYGICHWDWDPAWRKWISYSKNWFGRICSPCFLLFTTILFLISTFILMEYIGICYSNYEYITFLRCSPVKQSLLNSRWLPVGITGGVATGEQTRDGRGAGGVTGWTPGSIGINQCFLGDLLHRFGKNVIYCGLMGEVEDLWGNVENIGGKRHRNYIISLEIW